MIIDKGIPIKNVYYMLTYAFKELKRNNYEQIAGENFEDIHDLFAEILSLGIAYLLKHLLREQCFQPDIEIVRTPAASLFRCVIREKGKIEKAHDIFRGS